jgi:hypothetical protein
MEIHCFFEYDGVLPMEEIKHSRTHPEYGVVRHDWSMRTRIGVGGATARRNRLKRSCISFLPRVLSIVLCSLQCHSHP